MMMRTSLPVFLVAMVALVQRPSSIDDIRKLVGKTETLCGSVVDFTYPHNDNGGDCTVRLHVGGPCWQPLFYILVPKDALALFQTPPEAQYLLQKVCVTGLVQSDDKRIPHVVLASPSQIELPHEEPISVFGKGAYRPCEPDVVKPRLLKSARATYPSYYHVGRGVEHPRIRISIPTMGHVQVEPRPEFG